MNNKKTIIAIASLIFLILLVSSVYAETQIASQEVSPIIQFWNNIRHTLNIQPFSIVGDSRSCGISGQPNKEWNNLASGQSLIVSASSYCSSGEGLFDVFTNGWTPWVEFKNSVAITCGTAPCNVQLYCCPKPECTSNSDCSGGTCNKVTCNSEGSWFRCPNEINILYQYSSYSYCTIPSTITCWYRQDGQCYSRIYDKTQISSCSSTTYMDRVLFDSLSNCQGQLGKCTQNAECPSGKVCSGGNCIIQICTENWQCGSWSTCTNNQQTRTCTDSNNCGTTTSKPATSQNCGTCKSNGETCSINSECCSEWCNPRGILESAICDSTTPCTPSCTGKVCGDNGCGGSCGTCQSGYSCSNGQCTNVCPAIVGYKIVNNQCIYTTNGCEVTYTTLEACENALTQPSEGFCLDFAHNWLKDITKQTDCQTNTIILIVIVFAGFVLILKFIGGK